MQQLTKSAAIDWGLLLRLRLLGFACGLACSFAFPLALAPLFLPSEVDCFTHWSYSIGEFLALLTGLTAWSRLQPLTALAHGLSTLAWAVLVGSNCHLWIALWAGNPVSLHHGM